jgi:hypothetical protein
MDIHFKEGTPYTGLKAMTYQAMFICAEIFNKHQFPLVITSTTDGQHMENSFHYTGEAFDIRTRRMTVVEKTNLFNKIRKALTDYSKCFQVIMEENHIHIEYDWR